MNGFRMRKFRPSRRILRAMVRLRRATDGVAAVEFALILPFMLMLYLGSAETTQAVMASRKAAVSVKTLSDLVSQQASNTNMTDDTMGNIFNAASTIMQPFGSDSAVLSMNVSAVSFTAWTSAPAAAMKPYVWVPTQSATASTFTPTSTDPGYAAKVRWSVSPSTINTGSGNQTMNNAAALTRTCGANPLTPVASTVKPTASNLQQGLYGTGSIVVADISYAYTPTFGASIVSWTNSFSWSTSSGMTSANTTYMQPRNTWSKCPEASGTGATDTWICYSARETGTCATW
jgi:Flp pilus assembly protein TadG